MKKLYAVTLQIEIPVVFAGDNEALASDSAWLRHHRSDIFNGMDFSSDDKSIKNISVGDVKEIRSVDEIPENFVGALPFDHPSAPVDGDLECEKYFEE